MITGKNRIILFELLFVGAYLLPGSAEVVTYTLDPTLSDSASLDWTKKESYVGAYGRDPASGDTVVLSSNMTAKVMAGSDSWNLVTTLGRIVPQDAARLVVDVPATYEGIASLGVPVTEYGITKAANSGFLVKTGEGTLELASMGKVTRTSSSYYDYYLNIAVSNGILRLRQDGFPPATYSYMRTLDVAQDATVMTIPLGYSTFDTITGSGTLTNTAPASGSRLYIVSFTGGEFSGKITGTAHPLYISGEWTLLDCNQDFGGSVIFSSGALYHVRKLATADGATANSSFGIGNLNYSGSSTLHYIGAEGETETSSKSFWTSTDSKFDAGAWGGVTLTASSKWSGSGSWTMQRLTLVGSNTTEMVHAGWFNTRVVEGEGTYTHYIIKKGTGVWHFRENASDKLAGVIDVREGTLRFDSIAEQGTRCALGYSTSLYREETSTLPNGANKVGYAFVLGGEGTEGTMEYTGTNAAGCSTRPMAIRSSGRFVSDSARYDLANVYALGQGTKTLTLAGVSEHDNRATALSDGADGGKLDVVKDGEGTWRLWGTNTFTGSVVAKGGKLIVWNPEKRYTWFRFTAKENGYGCPTYDTTYSVGTNADGTAKAILDSEKGFLQITELAVYDSDGHNLVGGLKMNDDNFKFSADSGYRGLEPGYVGYGRTSAVMFNGTRAAGTFQAFDNLFDGNNKVLACKFACAMNGTGINIADESTWGPIVFRLPASVTNTAVAMDVASGRNREGVGSYNGRNLKSFRFEGSTDGITWDILFDDRNDLEIPETQPHWFSEPSSISYGIRKGKGYAFDQTESSAEPNHKYAFTGVMAANGGVLEIEGAPLAVSNLVIDASAAAGTLSNVVFAANGTIEVLGGKPGQTAALPGNYGNLAGVENLSAWSLKWDGVITSGYSIGVKDGAITLSQRGTAIMLQ